MTFPPHGGAVEQELQDKHVLLVPHLITKKGLNDDDKMMM